MVVVVVDIAGKESNDDVGAEDMDDNVAFGIGVGIYVGVGRVDAAGIADRGLITGSGSNVEGCKVSAGGVDALDGRGLTVGSGSEVAGCGTLAATGKGMLAFGSGGNLVCGTVGTAGVGKMLGFGNHWEGVFVKDTGQYFCCSICLTFLYL
ncbi:hypothetical protein SOVF_052490 [Spinacia oleracea]|nr:hypothetical protein SOVF_052490 [Spinacia oleracea]